MSESATSSRIAFVDASALVALADRDDASHQAAADAYQDFLQSGFLLFTTDLAFTTAHQLILAALGPSTARTWLAQCAIHIEPITAQDLEEGRRRVETGGVPSSAPLCDAIHLAVLDRLSVTDVFAVDQQFLGMLDD
jgi:predicted nucleic acid-binding protein